MRIAAIDVGTNSFHLLIARVRPDGGIEPIEKSKEMVRLGDSAFRGIISPDAFARGIEALRRFKSLSERTGCDAVIAVATSAVREAENGGEFVRVIRDETGIEMQVIRGDEEARLIFLGARSALNLMGRRALVVDIGGGSVELIVGDNRDCYYTASLKLGVLRLLDRFPISDPITPEERGRLAAELHRALDGPTTSARKIGFDLVAMSSGTARTIGELILGTERNDKGERDSRALANRRISFKDVYALEDKLCSLPAVERAKIPGLDAKRVDSIVPGVILVRSLLESVHADEYVFCDAALREGLVADYANRNRDGIELIDEIPDLRRRSVVMLARRCQVNQAHSEHVARLALDLFRGTRPLHNLPNSDGELLEFASLLHDIGIHISVSKHHKHSYYLITNTDLSGFQPDEILILGLIARYHRKSTPKETHEEWKRLNDRQRDRVRVLAALLRVADGLDRSYMQLVRSLRVRISEKTIELVVQCQGEPELEVWSARRKGDLLQEVFGRKLRVTVEKPETLAP